MAPKDAQLGKRVKLVSVRRPFVYGTTAKAYHEEHNPRPAHVNETHTHAWTVFVRGIDDDVDVTYWLRRVQFKLHESIPNHVRSKTPASRTLWTLSLSPPLWVLYSRSCCDSRC